MGSTGPPCPPEAVDKRREKTAAPVGATAWSRSTRDQAVTSKSLDVVEPEVASPEVPYPEPSFS